LSLFFILGALIEYALILYKKQKVNKYGIPSQSALAHKASLAAQRVAAEQQNMNPVGFQRFILSKKILILKCSQTRLVW